MYGIQCEVYRTPTAEHLSKENILRGIQNRSYTTFRHNVTSEAYIVGTKLFFKTKDSGLNFGNIFLLIVILHPCLVSEEGRVETSETLFMFHRLFYQLFDILRALLRLRLTDYN
jgi:hypothetical protein